MSTPTITETTTPPRTRWAAIIWGLMFAAIATGALWTLTDADRRAGVAEGLVASTPTTFVTVLLLSIGVLLLVGGAAGLIRRAQRKLAAAAPASTPDVPGPVAE